MKEDAKKARRHARLLRLREKHYEVKIPRKKKEKEKR